MRRGSPIVWIVALGVSASLRSCPSQEESPQPPPSAAKAGDDWARDYLDDDPLARSETISLADLQAALADPQRRDTVLTRHFERAALDDDQRRVVLGLALDSPSPIVRGQAAGELRRRGWLDDSVAPVFLELLTHDDAATRETAIIGLEGLDLSPDQLPENYPALLIEALASDDPLARDSAARQLERRGPEVVPALMEAVKSGPQSARHPAAAVLSRLASEGARTATLPAEPGWQSKEAITQGKSTHAAAEPQVERKLDDDRPRAVRVYFGTNRELVREIPDPRPWLWGAPVMALAAVGAAWWRLRRGGGPERSRVVTAVIVLAAIGGLVYAGQTWSSAIRSYYSEHSGAVFGPRRNAGTIYHGYCDVSLPPTHTVGQVEQPWFGAEDEQRHVVLQRTELLSDEAFRDAVRQALDKLPRGKRECFVFVHGYNTTFDQAARRTAQIHYDLQFPGAPLFFSWPSRGSHAYYPADRSEIQYSHRYVQQFLLEVAEQLDADRIHIIAHSMGADAVGQALASLGPRARLFDQIVLAAPDIDAGVFKEQIAPRLISQSRRTTMYCSKTDWALLASYLVNDLPRAGDSSRGILVIDEADTVDASQIDTSLLGHSYYGDCLPLLRDVRSLFEKNLPPAERDLKENLLERNHKYWSFADDVAAEAPEPPTTTEGPAEQ